MIEVPIIAFACMTFLSLCGAITVGMVGWIIWTVFREPKDIWGAWSNKKQPVRPEEKASAGSYRSEKFSRQSAHELFRDPTR